MLITSAEGLAFTHLNLEDFLVSGWFYSIGDLLVDVGAGVVLELSLHLEPFHCLVDALSHPCSVEDLTKV